MATTMKKAETEIEEIPVPKAEKKVTIRLPRDEDKEDKVVWVNERRYLIKKGVPVSVPESVALVLEQEERALQTIYDYEEKVQSKV